MYLSMASISVLSFAAFPTPVYNASILSDMLYERHLEVMYEAVSQCDGLKDAIPLLKVWLSQQDLTEVISYG